MYNYFLGSNSCVSPYLRNLFVFIPTNRVTRSIIIVILPEDYYTYRSVVFHKSSTTVLLTPLTISKGGQVKTQ